MTIHYNAYGTNFALKALATTYDNNKNLAICLKDEKTGEPFGTMTANTHVKLPDTFACIDINNMPGIENVIEEMHIAVPTGKTISPDGFVSYPVYQFDPDWLNAIRL